MLRSRFRGLRLLLVCAVLAFTSAPPRVVLGWFESIVALDTASPAEPPARSEHAPRASTAARAEAPRHEPAPLRAADSITLCAHLASRRPSAVPEPRAERLYLRDSALLC